MSVSILIVDDEPDVAEMFPQRFRREATMVGRGASLDGRLFLGGTDRRYGAGGEDVATSSLHVTDGVPRCPSRTT